MGKTQHVQLQHCCIYCRHSIRHIWFWWNRKYMYTIILQCYCVESFPQLFHKLKSTKIGWPPKMCIFEFWNEKLSFIFFFCFSFKNKRCTNVILLLVSIFYLWVLKNTEQNNICVFIVFKAESEPKKNKKKCFGGFLQKPKTHFFRGINKIVFKIWFQCFCTCS